MSSAGTALEACCNEPYYGKTHSQLNKEGTTPMRLTKTVASLLAASLFVTPTVFAATNSLQSNIALSANILQTVSVTVLLPTVAFGTVTPGASNSSSAISILSSWNLGAGQTLKLYAYFDSTTAMTGTLTSSTIPTSAMTGTLNSGSPLSFSASSPFTTGNTAATLYSVAITASNLVSTRTDSLAMTMDLVSLTSLPTDIYTGTMHLQAQAL